jgi:hypothetical protein
MEIWEQMQTATRSAFGVPAAADDTKGADRKSEADPKKGK